MSDENNKDMTSVPPSEDSTHSQSEIPEKSSSSKRYNTTQSVSDSISRLRLQLDNEKSHHSSNISIQIDGVDQAITFKNRLEILIGRGDSNADQQPDIDVSGLSINFSSISRKHLRLIFFRGSWYAEDMGSRNGTWLNGRLLNPHQRYQVRSEDTFQIGKVNLSVTIESEQAVESPPPPPIALPPATFTDKLILTTSNITDNQEGLSTTFLTQEMTPYLSAFIDIMRNLDRAKKRPNREISIVSIEFQRPYIHVKFSCKHEALRFLAQLETIQATKAEDEPIVHEDATQALNLNFNKPPLISPVDAAREFANLNLPLIAPEQSKHYQELFVVSLETILNHHLHVAN